MIFPKPRMPRTVQTLKIVIGSGEDREAAEYLRTNLINKFRCTIVEVGAPGADETAANEIIADKKTKMLAVGGPAANPLSAYVNQTLLATWNVTPSGSGNYIVGGVNKGPYLLMTVGNVTTIWGFHREDTLFLAREYASQENVYFVVLIVLAAVALSVLIYTVFVKLKEKRWFWSDWKLPFKR
jgi:hypothetical protein